MGRGVVRRGLQGWIEIYARQQRLNSKRGNQDDPDTCQKTQPQPQMLQLVKIFIFRFFFYNKPEKIYELRSFKIYSSVS